ncbi:MAG TPA: FeoA domain-containing protein [Acidimicrobiia bacterium]
MALAKSEPGPFVVRRVNERLEIDNEGIKLLAAAHLQPGNAATVIENVDGAVTVDTETGKHTLPKRVAENLFVSVS